MQDREPNSISEQKRQAVRDELADLTPQEKMGLLQQLNQEAEEDLVAELEAEADLVLRLDSNGRSGVEMNSGKEFSLQEIQEGEQGEIRKLLINYKT